MRSFLAFVKKEWMEALRSGKLLILGVVFCVTGIMNPAIAKLTPWLLEMMAEEMAESGMVVVGVEVDALTSWVQFFKNIPMALIAFVLVYGGSFTREYESGTLVLVLTKGLARYKVLLAKSALMLSLWTAGYWICYGITYGYNAYFWDNSIAVGLLPAAVYWWLFGIFTVALMVLFSVLTSGYSGVLLGTGGCVLASYILSMIPKLTPYLPTTLMNSGALLTGAESAEDFIRAVVVTAVATLACLAVSLPLFNKRAV